MEDNLPFRKTNRLKHASYSHNGEFFITVCAKDRKQIFGRIVKTGMDDPLIVGDGVLVVPNPSWDGVLDANPETRSTSFGNHYDVPNGKRSSQLFINILNN